MNIRPLDLQVMLPRTTEVSKVQQITEQQSSLQMQQSAKDWQKISEHRQQAVQQNDRSEGNRIRREQERDAQRHAGDEGKPEAGQEADAEADVPDGTGKGKIIDIRT